MRIILFFDLPRDTSKERKMATKFVKELKKEGFVMLQESVYCKLVLNGSSISFIKEKVEQIKPKKGNIMLLSITEKQFNSIEFLLGESQHTFEDRAERVIVL